MPLPQPRHPDLGPGSPTVAVEPYPWPKPPPGSPIWPSMAASTTAEPQRLLPVPGPLQRPAHGHHGADAAISCASSLIRVAGTPVIAEAHAGSLTTPSASPRRYRANRGNPTV